MSTSDHESHNWRADHPLEAHPEGGLSAAEANLLEAEEANDFTSQGNPTTERIDVAAAADAVIAEHGGDASSSSDEWGSGDEIFTSNADEGGVEPPLEEVSATEAEPYRPE